MVTREQVQDYVEQIKNSTGLKQFEISEQAGYGRKTLGQLISKGAGLEAVLKQLQLVFGERMKNTSSEAVSANFSADQLFHMYMKAMERQDHLLEGQMIILRNIESKMAQESTQAIIGKSVERIEASLQIAGQTLATLQRRQELGIEEFREQFQILKSGENVPSGDPRKKVGRRDGNG